MFALTQPGGNAGVAADMKNLPFRPGSFDTVLCLEGIEHLERHTGLKFLEEAARVVLSGGWFILSCPVLSDDRLHSGNEFHLYEWRETDLLASVTAFFELVDRRSIRGPAGEVLIILARSPEKSEVTFEAMPRGPDGRYQSAIQHAANWVESHWVGAEARYCQGAETTLLATTFAVLVSETIGSLARWDDRRVANVASKILEHQCKDTGLFGDHLVHEADLLAQPICDRDYLVNQMTYFCLASLSALGLRPRHPLTFALRFLDDDGIRSYIDDGPWHDVWNHSNRIMFVLRYLIHLMDEDDWEARAHAAFDTVLRKIEARQDSETGLWFGEGPRDHRLGVYAAYHFVPFFLWRGRPLNRVNNMIDAVLGTQTTEGLFADSNGGGACEDLDAIDLLVKLSYLSDYRSDNIRRSLRRAFDRILQLQCENGGFPNYLRGGLQTSWKRRLVGRLGLSRLLERWRPTPLQLTRYSGWTVVSAHRGEPDMWGTWFRSLSLNLIIDRLPQLGARPRDARYHGLPALGWHDQDALKRLHGEHRSNDSDKKP